MSRLSTIILLLALAASCGVLSCASGDGTGEARTVRDVGVAFDQMTVVRSSRLRFQMLDTADRSSIGARVAFVGRLDDNRNIDFETYVPATRVGDAGDLAVVVRATDGLWDAVDPLERSTFTGDIIIELDDPIGTFARGTIVGATIEFRSEMTPVVEELEIPSSVFPNQAIPITGDGFLRPEEGTTWLVVKSGGIRYEDGAERQVVNARAPIEWDGTRGRAILRINPALFGVLISTFEGEVELVNDLRTGEEFVGGRHQISFTLQPPRVTGLSPPAGSRGQKITISGRGFLPDETDRNTGMYLIFEGEFRPDNPEIPTQTFEGVGAELKVPLRVVDEQTIEQDVWYSVDPSTGRLEGLGATPGVFEGSITPVVYDPQGEQDGYAWEGTFRVLPTRQVVHVKYLPGFSRALDTYGLRNVETEIRSRILQVLRRDFDRVNVTFVTEAPDDFIEYTTIEIGGPDPSGLLNFGYDNSYNDGGKDIGNLYLGDYLGGVNRHSENAGYLPYGGVFIESFVAFSRELFPDGFGTSDSFDVIMRPFMPGLGGEPVKATEWPEGPRRAAIQNAIDLIGNLTGHTASHEIGHSVGLAWFPSSVEGFEERFHNDPPGTALIMDAGIDRPFEERAQLQGAGPASFSNDNLRYLQTILPPER